MNFFKALGIIKNVSLALGQQHLLTFPYPVHCSRIFIIFFYSFILINFIFITYIWGVTIRERGFNKWVSPFQELVESKGWLLFCEHKAPGFVDVVKEFYANMVE